MFNFYNINYEADWNFSDGIDRKLKHKKVSNF